LKIKTRRFNELTSKLKNYSLASLQNLVLLRIM
jgi:hypothetical protein